MPGSIRVARIFGIDIRIHVSWLLIFFLVVLNLSDQVFPRQFPRWSDQKNLVVAAVTAALFFGSVLAHELAHSLVARRFQMSVSSITLFLLGGVANLTKEPPSAKAEFFMAAAGPATSVVIGILSLGIRQLALASADATTWLEPVVAVASYLGEINLIVAVFNLIPGFPLDGGRVLRSVIWGISRNRLLATRIAARGGQAVAGLLLLLAASFVLGPLGEGDWTPAFWYGLIAYFLFNAASASLQQERISSVVGTVRVGQLMSPDFHSVQPGTTVGSLIRDLVLPLNLRAIPVVSGDRMLGIVTIGDLRKVEQERWSVTPVDQVMTRIEDLPAVTPEDPLTTALERFSATELPLLPVMTGRSLAGLLFKESVIGYVRMREMLGLEGRR
ncbi:MAG TPA: site-2 protease family protein [Candidatus Limnocylindria bacterium]|jgi:Zn-dependent protease|nr:site-2 protease family protein [Candidatus Limnocylindria bacterium]